MTGEYTKRYVGTTDTKLGFHEEMNPKNEYGAAGRRRGLRFKENVI